MAYALYTASYPTKPNARVTIINSVTGVPAIILAGPTGGVVSERGRTKLDASGNLSVYIDTAQTWTFNVEDNQGLVSIPVFAQYDPDSGVNTATLVSKVGGVDTAVGNGAASVLTTQQVSEIQALVSAELIVTDPRFGGIKNGDLSVALSQALDAAIALGNASIYIPAGSYTCYSLVSKSVSSIYLNIHGDGMGATRIIVPAGNTSGFLSIICSGRDSEISIEGISIIAGSTSGTVYSGAGTALLINQPAGGNQHQRNIVLRDVEVAGQDNLTAWFNKGIDLTGTWRPLVENCLIGGPFGFNQDLSNSSLLYVMAFGLVLDYCYSAVVRDTYVWSASTGISSQGDIQEALLLENTIIVGVKIGLDFYRTSAQPTLWITNCHVNYRDYGYKLNGAQLAIISHCVPYNIDTTNQAGGVCYDIYTINVTLSQISNCIFNFDGNPNRINIHIDGGGSVAEKGIGLSNNTFNAGCPNGYAIEVTTNVSLVSISNNQYTGTYLKKVNDLSGKTNIVGTSYYDANTYLIESQLQTGAAAPNFDLYLNLLTAVANGPLGVYKWSGNNSTNAKITYALMRVLTPSVTPGAEAGQIDFFTMYNGASVKNFTVGNGLMIGAPTGAQRGTGTLNMAGNGTLFAMLNGTAGMYSGTGSPLGVVNAAIGSIFLRTDGGTGTTMYVKESGASNTSTGWVAK